MTADNDVNAVFERHSISEVQELLTKTRKDIEKKKEELRVMVGERYRDLIQAADTISDMQGSAQAICLNIQTMEGLCESLQQRGLIGFKTHIPHPSGDSIRSSGKPRIYSVAIQVKILVSTPEILWELTEQGEFLPASLLFLLAQHTHTVLQLSPVASEVLKCFPVINRQWASISQFRSSIVKGCDALISSEIDDYQAVQDAVVAVMLVEGCTTSDAFNRVLHLRKSSLQAALAVRPSATTKGQITDFVRLLVFSLKLLQTLYSVDGSKSSQLEQRVREVVGSGNTSEADSEFSPLRFLQESSLALSFLPQSIVDFRPNVKVCCSSVDNEYLQKEVNQWLDSLLPDASQSIGNLLACTTSAKSLSLIRTSVKEVCREKLHADHWEKVTSLLHRKDFNPWTSLICDAIIVRAKQVIARQLETAKEAMKEMVVNLAESIISNPKICHEEGNISGFIWSESAGDLPERIGWTPAIARTVSQSGGLYHKVRYYTPRVQAICQDFNSKLSALIEDLSHYAPENGCKVFGEQMPESHEEAAVTDYSLLLQFLQTESTAKFISLVSCLEDIARKYLEKSKEFIVPKEETVWDEGISTSLDPYMTVLVLITRILHALPNVCLQMKSCSTAAHHTQVDVSRKMSVGMKTEPDTWQMLCGALKSANARLFSLLIDLLVLHFHTEVRSNLMSSLSSEDLQDVLKIFSTWATVTIEEEVEGGKMVNSSIHVPSHLTPVLSRAVVRLCSSLSCVAVHTLTRGMQAELASRVCETVIGLYKEIEESNSAVNQIVALQLSFDLRFVQAILLPRDNKEMASQLTALIQKYEEHIDPFDMNVFLPHLSTRVRLAAHRDQVLLGTIFLRDRQLASSRSLASNVTSASNSTLCIVAATDIPRFANVPLPPSTAPPKIPSIVSMSTSMAATFGSGVNTADSTFASKRDFSPSSRSPKEVTAATLTASRSAASLLSAMSSSWFGSSSSSF